jgi:predicted methyltransferase
MHGGAEKVLLLAVLGSLAGCSGLNPVASDDLMRGAGTAGTVSTSDVIRPGSAAALEQSAAERLADEQRAATERRQANTILEFFGIQPGMTVLDLYSAGGIYTELLSYVVGDQGLVIVHDNTPFVDFTRRETTQPFDPDKFTNVEMLRSTGEDLDLASQRFDAVLMKLAYREVYFVDAAGGWKPVDGDRLLEAVFSAMRPGGVLGIIDHRRTAAGTSGGSEAAGSAQRIDPELVRRELEAAGFQYEGTREIRDASVADGRGIARPVDTGARSGRTVMRFRKPRPAPLSP